MRSFVAMQQLRFPFIKAEITECRIFPAPISASLIKYVFSDYLNDRSRGFANVF
jgi:hypothetical protein